jgi:pimeloyl-ACP methyl ester carboxylesterase
MFMDALGIQSASLVGQSMGGGTAILFCVQHRQRVNKLLLVDPSALTHNFPLIGKFFNLPRVGEFIMGLSTNAIRKKTLGDIWIYNKKLITESYFENVTRFQKIKGTTEVLMAISRKEFFHTLSDEVHRLGHEDVPILIVWGREDKSVPVNLGQEMHRILKSSRLEIINNAGHVPNYECSDVFNRLASDFLQE